MGSSVAASAGTNAGTSPPAPVLGAGSYDYRGQVTFGTGTGPAAGIQVKLTFGVAYSGTGVAQSAGVGIAVTPMNAATAALGPWYATWDSLGRALSFGCGGTPTASQGNTVYALAYVVVSD